MNLYDTITELSEKLFMKGKIPVTYTVNSKMFESSFIKIGKNIDDNVKHTLAFNLFNNLTVNINISDKLQDGEIEYKFIYLSDYNFKNQDLQKSDKLQTMTTIYA